MKKIMIAFVLLTTSAFISRPTGAQNYDSRSTQTGKKSSLENQNDKLQAIKSTLETVIIVYKTHFDIGYSETVQQVVHDYRTSMTDRVLEAIDKNSSQPKDKQFVWTVSGWPMKQILWEGQAPERGKKLSS
jgi:alpha-mannosidase